MGVPSTGVVCHNGVSLHSTKEPCVPTKSCTHGSIPTATVDSPASQGLLFPIEATKSKGSQRERHTRPDSDRVRHDRFTCPSDLDRGAT
jgi:hypothetical protein